MIDPDNKLAQLFAEDEPTPDAEVFVASVHNRVARRRWGARTLGFCLVAGVAVAAGAVTVLAPEVVIYPVQLAQSVLTSPLGAAAAALGAIGLTWWSRYGDA